jgi:type II secretory ATPase GspE/PulE/Tfp pilus assembly ATPase PilB-like protein
VSSIPEEWLRPFCEKYKICPFYSKGKIDGILISQRSDLSILSYLKFRYKKQLQIRRVEDSEISRNIQDLFGNDSKPNDSFPVNHKSTSEIKENPSIIRLINEVIAKAISSGASDIHFEPFEESMSCRFRIDGVLKHNRDIARDSISEVIARIKIMSDLDISEKRRPQDGRIRFKTEIKTVDIRVSILPTDFGEKAVLRILDKETLRLDLKLLGLNSVQQAILEEKIALSNGMILVTGPTGSGKTTTLYAVLNRLRSPGVNITTIEDPIEYNLEGINQTQIKPEINVTFSAALRAILRQDPNIIMVGEIRDRETLDQAIRAALTGHLVLSTLHTNDAVSTITRMLDLGAADYLLSSTLKLIVAQRLVQTLCPNCKRTEAVFDEKNAAKALGIESPTRIQHAPGCHRCEGTGYLGRTALYEMVPIDTQMSEMIAKGEPEIDIRAYARKVGYRGLKEAGIEKIENGLTSPSEVLRAVAI